MCGVQLFSNSCTIAWKKTILNGWLLYMNERKPETRLHKIVAKMRLRRKKLERKWRKKGKKLQYMHFIIFHCPNWRKTNLMYDYLILGHHKGTRSMSVCSQAGIPDRTEHTQTMCWGTRWQTLLPVKFSTLLLTTDLWPNHRYLNLWMIYITLFMIYHYQQISYTLAISICSFGI